MPDLDDSYPAMVVALSDRFGGVTPRSGATDRFESILAAYLDRHLDARKAAALLDQLRDAGLIEIQTLAEVDLAELTDTVRQRLKSISAKILPPIQRLAQWAAEWESTDALAELSTERLREELRRIKGIGPGTADAILLLGFQRVAYPVDRATYRILVRHGWLDTTADYDEARALMERREPESAENTLRLAHWFEQLGNQYCRATVARCEQCPLRPFLPEGGPCEPESSA